MKATLIIQGDVTQINLQATSDAERRVLDAIREKRDTLITVGSSNIEIGESHGGTLRAYDRSPGTYDCEREPEAVALVFAPKATTDA